MSAHRAEYDVATMSRVLRVSRSGYYASRARAPSARALRNEELTEQIRAIHACSRGTYGAPRILTELREAGVTVNRKRVARLMAVAGIEGVSRRKKKVKTTVQDKDAPPVPDLVERDFTADGPNQLWVADITYIPTRTGFLYLAIVLDVFSRKIVGWAMATHLRTELVLDALKMAIEQRQPVEGLVHHSDRGCQYTSTAFGARCVAAGIRPSMGRVGSAHDNAMAESFFATLECELIDRTRFDNPHHASLEVFDFIEGFYNPTRRHSSIGNVSPNVFERRAAEKRLPRMPQYPRSPSSPTQETSDLEPAGVSLRPAASRRAESRREPKAEASNNQTRPSPPAERGLRARRGGRREDRWQTTTVNEERKP